MCIELNAHAIITLVIILRDFYLTWLLGSQTCERVFRSARSMTSTFSTIINFSMLGLMTPASHNCKQNQANLESFIQCSRNMKRKVVQTSLSESITNGKLRYQRQDKCKKVNSGTGIQELGMEVMKRKKPRLRR